MLTKNAKKHIFCNYFQWVINYNCTKTITITLFNINYDSASKCCSYLKFTLSKINFV